MKIKNLIAFIFLGLIAISCNKEPNDLRVLNLAGEFEISADQILSSNGPKFSFRVTTINDQDCKASEIIYTLIDQEGELNLILEDITQVDDCPTEEGILSKVIPLNVINGSTSVAVSLRNIVKNSGVIKTTDLQYIMQLDTPEGIIIGKTVVNRLPSQVLFGYIFDADQNIVDSDLLDSLSEFNTRELIDGYYTSYFSIDNQEVIYSGDFTTPPIHSDVYYHLEDKAAFIDYIQTFKEDNPSYGFHFRDAANGELILL